MSVSVKLLDIYKYQLVVNYSSHTVHGVLKARMLKWFNIHQMVNTEIRLIIFFEAKYGEALYSQQKEDQEWTMTQVMNSLLHNSDLN